MSPRISIIRRREIVSGKSYLIFARNCAGIAVAHERKGWYVATIETPDIPDIYQSNTSIAPCLQGTARSMGLRVDRELTTLLFLDEYEHLRG